MQSFAQCCQSIITSLNDVEERELIYLGVGNQRPSSCRDERLELVVNIASIQAVYKFLH